MSIHLTDVVGDTGSTTVLAGVVVVRAASWPLRRRLVRGSTRVICLGLVASFLLAGCHPTGSARCDRNLAEAKTSIEQLGWHLRCDPPFASAHLGQAGSPGHQRTVWIWPDNIAQLSDERLLRKVAWHERGHVEHIARGITFSSHAQREDWADAWAWCNHPISGVGYRVMPTDCTPYR